MAEQFPKLTRTDITPHLYSPAFRQGVAEIDAMLKMYPDESDAPTEHLLQEDAAVEKFNQTHFGLPWLERTAKLTLIAEQDENCNEALGVATHDVKIIAAIIGEYTEEITAPLDRGEQPMAKELSYRALSLLLMGDNDIPYAVPFFNGQIMEMQVDLPMPRQEAKTDLQRLRIDNETFQNLLTSETFLAMDLGSQKAQIRAFIEECEDSPIFTASDADAIFAVAVNNKAAKEPATIEGDTLYITYPGLDDVKKPFRTITDFTYGNNLWLEILDCEQDGLRRIPVNEINEIRCRTDKSAKEADKQEPCERVDMLKAFFTQPEIQELINDAENAINYCLYDDERDETILDYQNRLSGMLPKNYSDLSYTVSGVVFREQLKDEFEPKLETHAEASACDLDIKPIDGKWRVVAPFEIPTDQTCQTASGPEVVCETVYVIPSAAYVIRFDGIEDPEYIMHTAEPAELLSTAIEVNTTIARLVDKRRFYRASLERQIRQLKNELRPLQQQIESITSLIPGGRVACLAHTYYRVDWDNPVTSYADIAKIPCVERAYDNPAILEGDALSADIPELNEHRVSRFYKRDKFVLSSGLPMFILEDSEQQATYFIPATSIASVMPFIIKE